MSQFGSCRQDKSNCSEPDKDSIDSEKRVVKGGCEFQISTYDRRIHKQDHRPVIERTVKYVSGDKRAASAPVEYPDHHEGPPYFNQDKEGQKAQPAHRSLGTIRVEKLGQKPQAYKQSKDQGPEQRTPLVLKGRYAETTETKFGDILTSYG